MSAKDKIPRVTDPSLAERPYTARESWRIFGIMAEFVEATERLASVRPAVSIFGSARIAPEHPYYQKTEKIARLLSDAGFTVTESHLTMTAKIPGADEAKVRAIAGAAKAGCPISRLLNAKVTLDVTFEV